MKAELAGMTWDVLAPIVGRQSEMVVSISALDNRRLYLPDAVWSALGRPGMVRLLYSKLRQSIGIVPASAGDALAMVVTCRTKGQGRYASCAMLVRRLTNDGYSLPLSVPVQWHPDGLLWGDLTMATKRTGKGKGGAA